MSTDNVVHLDGLIERWRVSTIDRVRRDDPCSRYFAGVQRCMDCGFEHQSLQAAPPWAAHPASGECPSCRSTSSFFVRDDFEEYDPIVDEEDE